MSLGLSAARSAEGHRAFGSHVRATALTLSICLALSLAAREHARAEPRDRQRIERTVSVRYETLALGAFVGGAQLGAGAWYYDCLESQGCVILQVQSGERTVSLAIEDVLGLPVHAEVRVAGSDVPIAQVCGGTESPLRVIGYSELLVHVVPGTCFDEVQSSTPTRGTVFATFRGRRH